MEPLPPLEKPAEPAKRASSGMTRLVRPADDAAETVAQSTRHSSIVRRLRLILPLIAVAIIAVMLAWSDMDKVAAPVKREDVSPQTMGKNELLNPKFQSEDTNKQPYTITADRAFQESQDLDRVILEKPVADIALKSGAWIAIKAKDGEYFQGEQKLKLNGDVRMFHDKGYEITSQKIDLDVTNQTAQSDLPVSGQGPSGTIEGTGLRANGTDSTVIFTGPAKLILHTTKATTP